MTDLKQNNPYEIMTYLRSNKYLYKYLEEVAVVVDGQDEWNIIGNSIEGECCIKLLTTGILRISFPIFIKEKLLLETYQKMLTNIQQKLEGILSLEFVDGEVAVQYLLHTDIEGLDEGLNLFNQEKLKVTKAFEEVAEVIGTMMSSISNSIKNMNSMPNNNSKKSTGDNLWDTISDFDKQSLDNNLDDDLNDNIDEDVD